MAQYHDINTLAAFLGPRDINEVTQSDVRAVIGKPQADVCVLFGGSIPAGGDIFAKAIREKVAKTYIIVGGAGHTTQTLRDKMQPLIPDFDTTDLAEAVIFNTYLMRKYGVSADFLETESTNCGNNITLLLELLNRKKISCESIIICQDATMQRRMEAVLLKHAPTMQIINYATYTVNVTPQMEFDRKVLGMWDMERYISLLMGEMPRLTDDENGYGPKGKDYLAHIEIPAAVRDAFANLSAQYADLIREANPAFADVKKVYHNPVPQ